MWRKARAGIALKNIYYDTTMLYVFQWKDKVMAAEI
jgi:hypothetical protein